MKIVVECFYIRPSLTICLNLSEFSFVPHYSSITKFNTSYTTFKDGPELEDALCGLQFFYSFNKINQLVSEHPNDVG